MGVGRRSQAAFYGTSLPATLKDVGTRYAGVFESAQPVRRRPDHSVGELVPTSVASWVALKGSSEAPVSRRGNAAFRMMRGAYRKLPVSTDAKGKVEVLEFFHYGCPHCRNFDPLLEQWVRKLPADVVIEAIGGMRPDQGATVRFGVGRFTTADDVAFAADVFVSAVRRIRGSWAPR